MFGHKFTKKILITIKLIKFFCIYYVVFSIFCPLFKHFLQIFVRIYHDDDFTLWRIIGFWELK